MSFLKLAYDRYSVRKFQDRKVEKEFIHKILEAGRIAPTSANLQPQRILVIQNEEGLEKIKEATYYHFDAPLIFLICYDQAACWKNPHTGHQSGEVDASIVTTHMMLEIADLGLGSTWVGSFDPRKLRNSFQFPENIIPIALLAIGYPSEHSSPHPNHDRRLEEWETVFFENFPADY